jgi:hypothetical protein
MLGRDGIPVAGGWDEFVEHVEEQILRTIGF